MEREEEKYLNDLMDLPQQEYTKAPETSTPKRKRIALGDVNTSNQGLPQPQTKKRVRKSKENRPQTGTILDLVGYDDSLRGGDKK